MRVRDAETGYEQYLDTSSKAVRTAYKAKWLERQAKIKETFSHSGVDYVSVSTADDYVRSLMMLFKRRS